MRRPYKELLKLGVRYGFRCNSALCYGEVIEVRRGKPRISDDERDIAEHIVIRNVQCAPVLEDGRTYGDPREEGLAVIHDDEIIDFIREENVRGPLFPL